MHGKLRHIVLIAFLLSLSLYVPAQNKKADGYMGLWYRYRRLSSGISYAGGMATFSSQHNPIAIYSAAVRKTFFVYCGTSSPDTSNLQVMVSYFDHKTGKVPKPVIVYDKMGVNDPQDNGTISIDSVGYIWIFISGRGRTRPGYIFKSRKPFSIDAFDLMKQGEIVFPQPWWIGNSFLLMQTKVKRGRELYWRTGDGKSWSPEQKLAGMGGHFQVTNVLGNTLFSAFNYCPDGNNDKRTNLYLVKTPDMGKTWLNVSGEIVKTPVEDIQNNSLIHDFKSEKKLVYINDLNFDNQGNPVILAIISPDSQGPAAPPKELTIIHWNENSWKISKICDVPHNQCYGSVYPEDDVWKVFAPSDEGSFRQGPGGEVAMWISNDKGKSWQKAANVTSKSVFNNSYVRRPLNASNRFYAFWSDGDPSRHSECRIYFTNEKGNKVWALPYTMKKEMERPVRIK